MLLDRSIITNIYTLSLQTICKPCCCAIPNYNILGVRVNFSIFFKGGDAFD